MRVGIVGHGADKFTEAGEQRARERIRACLVGATTMVSGHSPVGGIDIWAEEEAEKLGIPLDLKIPEVNQWNPPGGYGFKARNLDIAETSDVVHVILSNSYPEGYSGRRFDYCYHCMTQDHPKSGGCWTGRRARAAGHRAKWHVVSNS